MFMGGVYKCFKIFGAYFRKNISAASTVVYGAIVSCSVSDEPVLIVEAVGEMVRYQVKNIIVRSEAGKHKTSVRIAILSKTQKAKIVVRFTAHIAVKLRQPHDIRVYKVVHNAASDLEGIDKKMVNYIAPVIIS